MVSIEMQLTTLKGKIFMNNVVLNDVKDIHQLFKSSHYAVKEKIGEGGFGQVYLADQINTGQKVAIKFLLLNQHLTENKRQRYIARFNRETALCSQLSHPNIVRLYDKGQCGEHLLYAVFEYIEGVSLKEWLLENGAIEPVVATEIMLQILDGLAHAHEKGIIHRDIKPANIMLSQSRTRLLVRILDFGIGTLVQEARQNDYKTITLTHETFGTPSYSAPEQLRGEPPTLKTDLYVWGLLFLECLTGQPAVRGASMASIFHKQLSQHDVPIPAALVEHPLGVLLRKALRKQSFERNVEASELYQQLKAINVNNIVGAMSTSEPGHYLLPNGDLTATQNAMNLFTGVSERKQITVLALSLQVRVTTDAPFDQEVVEAIYRDQKSQVIDTAIRYGGFHVGSLGDVALIYFGYPSVTDNDARLCARAALDIISLQTNRNTILNSRHGFYVEARLAIHTGMVTIYGENVPEGETANLAMALSRHCDAGQILCSMSTQRVLSTYIEIEPMPGLDVGYRLQPMPVYSVLGERSVEAFGFLRGSRKELGLIGRQSELQILLQAFGEAAVLLEKADLEKADLLEKANAPLVAKAVHLHGEAGIGKSRLIFEVLDHKNTLPQFIGQCLPEHYNNALYPILRLVRYKLSLDGLTDDMVTAGITDFINQARGQRRAEQRKALPILLTWLNVPLPNDVIPSAEAPEVQKAQLFAFISDILLSSEYDSSHLFVIEDIHWADYTSLEFLQTFVPTALQVGNVVISTSRQPLPPQFADLPYQPVLVDKLAPEETENFIHALFNSRSIEPALLQLIIERTDGIPLFIEEFVAALQQQQLVHQLNGQLALTDASALESVPLSLRDSLQHKLDALPNSKETAQLAAAIGREFDYKLLVAASAKSEEQVQQDLDELVSATLLFKQRRVDGDMYIFKHALVRDAAYESALSRQLIEYHRHIAQVLTGDDDANKNALLIAQHFTQAKEPQFACDYAYIAIGNQVANRAYREARETYDTMITVADEIHEPFQQAVRWVQLKSALLPALTMTDGWGAESIMQFSNGILGAIRKAYSLSGEPVGFEHYEHIAERALLMFHHYQGNRKQARELGEALLSKVLRNGDRQKELMVRTTLGQAYFFDSDFKQARDVLSRVIEIYDQKSDLTLHHETGFDPFQFSTGNLMCIEAITGNLVKAENYYRLCIEHALKTDNIAIVIVAYTFGTCLFFLLNDKTKMAQCTNEAIDRYGDDVKSNWIYRNFYMMHDWTLNEYEQSAKTVAEDKASGQDSFLSWYEPSLCDTYLNHGMTDQAIALMTTSVNRSAESGEGCILAMNYRYLANAFYQRHQKLEAQSLHYYQLAIDDAKARGSLWLQLLASFEFLRRHPPAEIAQSLVDDMSALIPQIEGIESTTWYQPVIQELERYTTDVT